MRRMFESSVIESDKFLSLPISAQCLYFHLCLNADDDGFINGAKRMVAMMGLSGNEDLKALEESRFIIPFSDTGVYCIRHWKIHNYIRKDRYRPTQYCRERALLGVENDVYTLKNGKTEEQTGAGTELAKEIYDLWTKNGLPIRHGNFPAFLMGEFNLALHEIQGLGISREDLIKAVENYAAVIQLKHQGRTWWSSEVGFYSFVASKDMIHRFLPGNFELSTYEEKTRQPGRAQKTLPSGRKRIE